MGTVSLGTICEAIKDTLATATGVVRSQGHTDLTDDFEDLPLLRVYPQSGSVDAWSEGDRSSFRALVRVTEYTFNADLICRQRALLDEDMSKAVEMQATVEAILEAQKVKPYFGLADIKAFRWRWDMTDFTTGSGESMVHYLGIRFSITVRIF